MTILEKLKQWQAQQARKEGVESYRVLPYKTLVELAHVAPQNEVELLSVKGIGAIKVRRYGADLLSIINNTSDSRASDGRPVATIDLNVHDAQTGEVAMKDGEDVFGVSDFLSALNVLMSSHFQHVRVRGEIVDFRRNHTGHAYFQIKDAHGILRVTVFRHSYDLSGVELADGLEVVITGYPQHHAQYGFSFMGETVELAGEGALKKAYDTLKKKCAESGFFDDSRKRPVPRFVTNIGLITSRDGAAIGDFMTNLSPHGFSVRLIHSAVEGQHAVHELMQALRQMHKMALSGMIDVLVLTRGGGSLESLQAFNNENIIRMLVSFPVPVIAGIGHERDETLATLVADAGVSTPTAAAKLVCASWADAQEQIARIQHILMNIYADTISNASQKIQQAPFIFTERFRHLLARFEYAQQRMRQHVFLCDATLQKKNSDVENSERRMIQGHERAMSVVHQKLNMIMKVFDAHDPRRLLARGYAIIQTSRGIVRNIDTVKPGDMLNVRLSNGTIETVVEKVSKES